MAMRLKTNINDTQRKSFNLTFVIIRFPLLSRRSNFITYPSAPKSPNDDLKPSLHLEIASLSVIFSTNGTALIPKSAAIFSTSSLFNHHFPIFTSNRMKSTPFGLYNFPTFWILLHILRRELPLS